MSTTGIRKKQSSRKSSEAVKSQKEEIRTRRQEVKIEVAEKEEELLRALDKSPKKESGPVNFNTPEEGDPKWEATSAKTSWTGWVGNNVHSKKEKEWTTVVSKWRDLKKELETALQEEVREFLEEKDLLIIREIENRVKTQGSVPYPGDNVTKGWVQDTESIQQILKGIRQTAQKEVQAKKAYEQYLKHHESLTREIQSSLKGTHSPNAEHVEWYKQNKENLRKTFELGHSGLKEKEGYKSDHLKTYAIDKWDSHLEKATRPIQDPSVPDDPVSFTAWKKDATTPVNHLDQLGKGLKTWEQAIKERNMAIDWFKKARLAVSTYMIGGGESPKTAWKTKNKLGEQEVLTFIQKADPPSISQLSMRGEGAIDYFDNTILKGLQARLEEGVNPTEHDAWKDKWRRFIEKEHFIPKKSTGLTWKLHGNTVSEKTLTSHIKAKVPENGIGDVSGCMNDMILGRGKATGSYTDVLHASAGKGHGAKGGCTVFFLRKELKDPQGEEITLLGVGQHTSEGSANYDLYWTWDQGALKGVTNIDLN